MIENLKPNHPTLSRRQALQGLSAVLATAFGGVFGLHAMMPTALAQSGVLFNDPAGYFRARFPNNPVRVDLPMKPDSWQWFKNTDFFIASGLTVTTQISRLHWTPRFKIAMQVEQSDPAGAMLADDQAIMREALAFSAPIELQSISSFEAFETRGLQIYLRDLGEENPRPLRLIWAIPYEDVLVAGHVMAADQTQFNGAEASAFNQSFEVFSPSVRRAMISEQR